MEDTLKEILQTLQQINEKLSSKSATHVVITDEMFKKYATSSNPQLTMKQVADLIQPSTPLYPNEAEMQLKHANTQCSCCGRYIAYGELHSCNRADTK